MNLKNLNIAFLIALILSVILLPVLMGASILDFSGEDNFADQDDLLIINHFSVTWARIPVHQMSVLFRLGISIFALFVVYLGGRSKHRRFNDRTIDAIHVLNVESFVYLKTARIRAVFVFLCFILNLFSTNAYRVHAFQTIFIIKKELKAMISSILRSSLKFQFLVLTVVVALVAFGVTQFRPVLVIAAQPLRLPIFPSFLCALWQHPQARSFAQEVF